jgi:predicted Zn-dependent peptidase
MSILGGWLGSRLHTRLRNESGLTYSIGTDVLPRSTSTGMSVQFGLHTQVSAPDAHDAWHLILQELVSLCQHGITEDELRLATNWMLRSQLLCLDTPNQVVAQHAKWCQGGFPIVTGEHRSSILGDVTVAEVSAAAAKLLAPDLVTVVAAGNMAQRLPDFTVVADQ